jgi:hypothetical protein
LLTDQAALESLVDEVARKTSGTSGDPLSRDEVKTVVTQAVKELRDNPEVRTALMAHGIPSSVVEHPPI